MGSRRRLSLFLAAFGFVSQFALCQPRHAVPELRLPASCGQLRVTAQAENAIRVRCGSEAGTQEHELIFTGASQHPRALSGSDAGSSWLQTSKIKAIVDKRSGDIRFLDAKGKLLSQELPGSRQLTNANSSDGAVKTAEVQFALQPAEHLYGSGQFQDGYLDIARLPRKLIQLNTQISIPFFLSSRGYGILWHNY